MSDWRQSWNSSKGSNSSKPPKFLRTAWISWLSVRYKPAAWPSPASRFFLTSQYSILIRLKVDHIVCKWQHNHLKSAYLQYGYYVLTQTKEYHSPVRSTIEWIGIMCKTNVLEGETQTHSCWYWLDWSPCIGRYIYRLLTQQIRHS